LVQYNALPTNVGSNTLYTCPAGKKVCVVNNCIYNPTAGAISYFIEVSRGGVYRQVLATVRERIATQPTFHLKKNHRVLILFIIGMRNG
jgi:hypothetical protein